eukprot:718358-Rhodomonas_salina.3
MGMSSGMDARSMTLPTGQLLRRLCLPTGTQLHREQEDNLSSAETVSWQWTQELTVSPWPSTTLPARQALSLRPPSPPARREPHRDRGCGACAQ